MRVGTGIVRMMGRGSGSELCTRRAPSARFFFFLFFFLLWVIILFDASQRGVLPVGNEVTDTWPGLGIHHGHGTRHGHGYGYGYGNLPAG